MILPYIDIPETVQTKKKPGKTAASEPASIVNNTFLYDGGMIDHPVLDFKFAESPRFSISTSESLLEQSEADLAKGNFEEKYLVYSEKIEKERFARELLAGNG